MMVRALVRRMAYVFVGIAVLLTIGAGDLVIESAGSGGATLTAFGTQLATPGIPAGVWILCGAAAIAGIALTASLARVRGRGREHAMAAEVDARWEELSHRNAGVEARNELLTWRIAELQPIVDDLVVKRDETIVELREVEARRDEVRAGLRSGGLDEVVVVPPVAVEPAGASPEPVGATPEPVDAAAAVDAPLTPVDAPVEPTGAS